MVHEIGQDGGLVSAMLIWLLDHDYIDGALTSFLEGDGSTWKAIPGVAANKEEVLASAGSRYTYSANTLALKEAQERGLSSLALVGMGCQTSSPPVMWHRKVGKVGKPFVLNIGLMCSKTFDDAIFEELFEAKYGIKKADIKKVNIKGVFQIWCHDGSYHEVNLKECHAWTREGCNGLPRLRRRARRHLHRRHRQVQRLDADRGAHRPRPGGHRADAGRRVDHQPPGRRRPRRHQADAPALDREPPALAQERGSGGRRSGCHRPRRRPRPPSRPAEPPAEVAPT